MKAAPAAVARGGGLAAVLLLPLWFNPYARAPFEPAKAALFCLLTAAMAIAWLGGRLQGQRERAAPRAIRPGLLLAYAAAAYAGAVLLATAASVDPRLSLRGTDDKPLAAVTLAAGVIFFLALADGLRRPDQVLRLVKGLNVASVPVTIYGVAQALGLDPLPWISDSVSPVHATLGRSNYLGAYLAMVAPWTLALVLLSSRYGAGAPSTDGKTAWRLGIVLLLQVTCLALTLARGAWLGLIVGCAGLLALLASRWRERRLWLAAGLVLAVGAAALAALTFLRLPAGEERAAAAGLTYPALRAESAWRRSVIWQHALALAPQRWLLGYGPATFEQVFSARYPPGALYQGADAVVADPHNWLLDRLLATGVIGLAAYAGVLAAFYRTGLALWRRPASRCGDVLAAAAAASVAAYLTQALFSPDVVVLGALFWLALAIVVALARMDPPIAC